MRFRHIIIAGIAIFLSIVISFLPVISKHLVTGALQVNGFSAASIDGFYFTPRGILIDTINLSGDGKTIIEHVAATGTWHGIILQKQFDVITIKNINIAANVTADQKINIAGYSGSLTGGGQKNSATPAPITIRHLPVKSLAIEQMNFDITTPQGPIKLQSHLSLQTKADKQILDVRLTGDQTLLSLAMKANGNLSQDGSWNLKTDIENLRGDMDGFSAARGSGWFKISSRGGAPLSSASYAAQIDMGLIRLKNLVLNSANLTMDSTQDVKTYLTAHPSDEMGTKISAEYKQMPAPRFVFGLSAPSLQKIIEDFGEPNLNAQPIFNNDAPVVISIEKPMQDLFTLPLEFQTKIEFPTIPLSFEIPSIYDEGIVNFTVPKTVIDSSAVARIVNLLPYNIFFTGGNFNVVGNVGVMLSPFSVRGPLTISVQSIEGLLSDYNFKNLSSQMEFSSLLPLTTNGAQKIILDTLETGLPLEKISGALTISQDKGAIIDALTAHAAGGTITASPISFKNPKFIQTIITLNKLNLKYLFAKDGSDISAEGLFSGRLPITFDDKGLQIKGGLITNNGVGILRYTPAVLPNFMAGDDPRMETVRLALSDYRFDSMSLTIDGFMDGDLKTSLKANGTNPIFDKRPVKLNLNIEGALVPAIKQALQPSALSDKIKKEITKGTR